MGRKDIKINSHSRERLLIEALQNEISLDAVKKEIDHCVKENTSTTSCLYVTRTVYRFLPEFVKKGYTMNKLQVYLELVRHQSMTSLY